jgi:cyclic pyranopterin phosphate synthase
LYDEGVLNIKSLMREGRTDDEINVELMKAFQARPKDGFEAEELRKSGSPVGESMSTIGG